MAVGFCAIAHVKARAFLPSRGIRSNEQARKSEYQQDDLHLRHAPYGEKHFVCGMLLMTWRLESPILRGHAKESDMLWTVFVVLLVLWLLGLVSSYTLGGFIHLLLVLALVVLVINLVTGRRTAV
jgi:hypothetical protein